MQAKQEEFEEKIKSLKLQHDSFAAAANNFALEVEQAVDGGGRQLHSRLRDALDSFRRSSGLDRGVLGAKDDSDSRPLI
jgi:hypothetical protein